MHSARLLAVRAASIAALVAMTGCGSVEPPAAVGKTSESLTANDKIAFDYFLARGLTNVQAAAIVGNLDQESGMDPASVQAGGPGRGIAQWSMGGRWDTTSGDNATEYASAQGKDLLTLELQLDFVWFELTTFPAYGLSTLRQSTNVQDATIAFSRDFEQCGSCQNAQRVVYAQAALDAYGGDVVDAGAATDAGAAACFVSELNAAGFCVPTAECAARPNHVSTAGHCPGAKDIQCCTGPSPAAAGASDASVATDGALLPGHDGGSPALDPSVLSANMGGGCALASPNEPHFGAWWPTLLGLAAFARKRRRRANVSAACRGGPSSSLCENAPHR